MRKQFCLALCLFCLLGMTGAAQAPKSLQNRVTAFLNVNVIPMDRERVLQNQTVIVRDGTIVELGAATKIKVPQNAVRINAQGQFLIPGLMDMHTHLFSDDAFPDSLAGDEFAIMLANGVTTIRLMIGTPEHLRYRENIARGEMFGPQLFVASPEFTGNKPAGTFNGRHVITPEQASAAVRECKAAGYDFIKLTTAITRPVYDAVIATAKEIGIPVVGHVDLQVGLDRALQTGQHIEHLDSYAEALLRADAPSKSAVSDMGVWRKANWANIDFIDENKISAYAKATAKTRTFTCPTLTFFKLNFSVPQTDEEIRARPDFRFYPKNLHARLFAAHTRFWTNPPSAERREKYQRVRNQLVKEIHAAGGKIMAGSDAPELFLVYGFTLHRELQSLVEAGLTPFEALAAATRTPAEFLRMPSTAGTIERGKRADFVLLQANPLANIANTEKRVGVMVRGRWMPQTELNKLLDEIAGRFQALN